MTVKEKWANVSRRMTEHSEWGQHKVFGNLLCKGLPTDLCVDGTSGLSPWVAFQTVRQQKDQSLQPLTWPCKKQFNRTA